MWYNIPGAFSKEYCKQLIGYFTNIKSINAETEGVGVNKSVRNTDIRFASELPEHNSFENNLHVSVDRLIKRANTEYFNYDLNYNEAPQFGEYKGDTKSFYDWHDDVLYETNFKHLRKLSLIVLLNNSSEYKGGKLELDLPDFPKNFNQAGDALLFPSFLKHKVNPVQEGTRYSLVCWSNGPAWR
ncbi:2OG-Fe(II) oxygenase [bacterium]|nr:2OG-Fe(II) oxygenase [bacterium]